MDTSVLVSTSTAMLELEAICEKNEAREFVLPSGRRVLVTPAPGLVALAAALDDPATLRDLEEAAAQFAAGKIESFDP